MEIISNWLSKTMKSGFWLIQFIFLLLSGITWGQGTIQNVSTQRLLLQLGSFYLNIARQNQIDIDSALALAANRAKLNKMVVIGEGFDDIVLNPANKWVAAEDINAAKKIAMSGSVGSRARLLSLIGFMYAFRPSARKNDIDSSLKYLSLARKLAEEGGDLRTIAQSLIGIGKCYLEAGSLRSADSVFNLVITSAVKIQDRETEAMALAYWGIYSPFQPQTILDRIDRLRRANALYEQLGKRQCQPVALTGIAYLSYAANRKDDAKQSALNALSIERSIGFPYTHYTADLIGIIGATTGDHESNLKYSMYAVRTAEALKDSIALAYLFANRSAADFGYVTGNADESIMWAQKALSEFKRLGGDPAMYTTAWNLASQLVVQNRDQEAIDLLNELVARYPPVSPIDKQEAYLSLAAAYERVNTTKTEKFLLAAEHVQKETVPIRGDIGAANLYMRIGTFYFNNNQYEKSRIYLNKAMSIPNSNVPAESMLHNEIYLAKIDSASGNFKEAYNHAMKIGPLSDSIHFTAGKRQVSELRVQYQTQKKEDDIKLLNHQAAAQRAQMRQDRFIRNLMIAGSVLLMVVLGLLYSRFRLKQRTNRQLEFQQAEIAKKNISLERLLKEKEWLLKEVHHRVKNNLHTVICLLESQAEYLENDALKALEISQHRIYVMSLIHQKLYQSGDMKTIDMSVYLPEFVHYLSDSFGTGNRIRFKLKVEPLYLGLAQAIPVALIVNEAITNSIKHAFPENRKGIIEITMQQKDTIVTLVVADDGIGSNAVPTNNTTGSLGLKLIRGLSDDLNAQINFVNTAGTRITLNFYADPFREDGIVLPQPDEKEMIL